MFTQSQMDALESSDESASHRAGVTLFRSVAYAAPVMGSWFFYIPMWSILPGMYAKYFGLKLTSIATVVLAIRLFDGVIDTATGYLSDRHRLKGGSRKTWVIVGCIGVIVACFGLFLPPVPATTGYYLMWSMLFFLAFTIAEIPHVTWGVELTMGYQERATVFGVRNFMCRVGMIAFFVLPLLPMYSSSDYTPQVIRDALYVGATLTVIGLAFAIAAAPAGMPPQAPYKDSARALLRSIVLNKPLLVYFASFTFVGLAGGMWFALVYFYLDSYLRLGGEVAMMFLLGYLASIICTPMWLKVIRRTNKSITWAMGIGLFVLQMILMYLLTPGSAPWTAVTLVIVANIYFCCLDISALAILGDIVDYGKLRFKQDRGATYFAINALIFKCGLGIGGGLALKVAGSFGFDPTATTQSSAAIVGLKIGFTVLPAIFALVALIFVLRTPINQRRYSIIQRRIESRQLRNDALTSDC